ncbi:unknown [[Mannheimia] succiniciproducens MBEL55E]|uniref:Uncharacterized protein n=1 Tax=Mannheimia succiniciproducens (strain KCTC 0769BP / MBEL55E) TaxID=221988 RepID=Q65SS2_MANSM|nr:unknown [[Mannheimia] succiniciproducens MBEL55E]
MQQYHDPDSPLLLGYLRETDVVTQSPQKSFLATRQMDLIILRKD